jgi:hypothetical protein
MTFYRHLMSGPNPGGDIWNASIHSSSSQSLASVHAQFTTAITTFWSAATEAIFPSGERVTGLSTTQLDPTTGKNVARAESVVSFVGTGAGNAAPPRVSIVISLVTALPTRSGRGRLYLPAPALAQMDANGALLGTAQTLLSTNFAQFVTTMHSIAPVVVYHGVINIGGPNPVPSGTEVTSVKVGSILGTQRRRTNKQPNNYVSHVV